MGRNRIKQTTSLNERLRALAQAARDKAEQLSPGDERDLLLQRAKHADRAIEVHDWLRSPGLPPPV
ncbi:hypothetical protein JQ604_01980 [Bradyrhizobium jicamae]|uniref:hypothetical protein n=1 Tax=Bradyrhizobium jicamae TaxID=280332 RepID=UPI001BA69A8A|nr:hypothetical protein [Bradyrhizobium jicamae]MBR0750935.1 hypothetical protein [Bradyrhizobium jicamae]